MMLIFFSQVYASSSDSLLHLVCREGLEEAGLLLCLHGANPNHVNKKVSKPFYLINYQYDCKSADFYSYLPQPLLQDVRAPILA